MAYEIWTTTVAIDGEAISEDAEGNREPHALAAFVSNAYRGGLAFAGVRRIGRGVRVLLFDEDEGNGVKRHEVFAIAGAFVPPREEDPKGGGRLR